MKKIIALPAGKWAAELLTLSGAERIDYFLDDDKDVQESGFPIGRWVKPVYPIEHILSENIEEILVVITDTGRYRECRDRLSSLGLVENLHFFDGWHLDLRFYRALEDSSRTWAKYEESLTNYDFSEFEPRAKKMASLIPEDVTSIMDMGCGAEILRKYLRPGVRYYGLDLVRRNTDTLICDANHEPLPDLPVDAYYMAGFLVYINDASHLLSQMRGAKYLLFDLRNYIEYQKFGNIYMNVYTRQSRSVAWNDRDHFLKLPEMIEALSNNGFVIEKAIELDRIGTNLAYLARNIEKEGGSASRR